MKYWAYLNNEVSQTSYTEEELKRLPGFSSDLLICSEASAVSSEPDWRPVKDLLPHLIRPKAPDFSKFRPKPPMPGPGAQNNSNVLPVPESLPVGVNAAPAAYPEQTQVSNNINAELLAQIKSLTDKIAHLEGEIAEGHKEIALSDKGYPVEIEGEETFVSEPVNDAENDVLEVPFDNDFEVPFDTANKSSEEIAKEAEAMLNEPISTEIEEFNADDQHSELLDYSSDMQKILEDTVRKTNVFPNQDVVTKKGKTKTENEETKSSKRVFIAEDLISKTTLSFTDRDEEDIVESTLLEERPQNTSLKEQKQEKNSQKDINDKEGKTIQEAIDKDYPVEEGNKEDSLQEDVSIEDSQEASENLENDKGQEDIVETIDEEPAVVEEEPEVNQEPIAEKEAAVKESPEPSKEEHAIADKEPEKAPAAKEKTQPSAEEPVQEGVKEENSKENSAEENKEEYPPIDNLDNIGMNAPVMIPTQDSEEEEEQKQDSQNADEKVEFSDKAEEVAVKEEPSEDNSEKEKSAEQAANLSMTKGVSLSQDATTAAVLDEIAMEKEAQNTKPESTVNKLFEELENTYKDEKDENAVDPLEVDTKTLQNPEYDAEATLESGELKEDEFLKTFTTSVEEVFLDQPTAIISDYVPPNEDNTEHGKHEFADNGIKREKPSDIKTVPLVPQALGQEIWSSPYVESATTKLGKGSTILNLFKWIFSIVVVALLVVGLISGLAVMGIINEKFSPIHTVIYSLQKSRQQNAPVAKGDLSPEIMDESLEQEQTEQKEQNQGEQDLSLDVITNVKNYTFNNGTTLESRIKSAHQNLQGEIEWSVFPTEEQNIYSIAVKIPAGPEGQGFSYRFNYNLNDNALTPTTSLAKNIMEG